MTILTDFSYLRDILISMKKLLVALISLNLLLTATLFTQPAQSAPAKKYRLSIGVVSEFWTIYGGSREEVSKTSECVSDDSVREGITVRIRDANRKVIGASTLKWKVIKVNQTGAPLQPTYEPGDELPYEGICALTAVIPALPKTSFYEVLLGKVDGGTYSFSSLDKKKWNLVLSL